MSVKKLAPRLDGFDIGQWLYHEGRVRGRWTNLTGEATDPWVKRLTPESKFIHEPDPQWVKITMITHKKNRDVVVRTIDPDEGHPSEWNIKFTPDQFVRVAEEKP